MIKIHSGLNHRKLSTLRTALYVALVPIGLIAVVGALHPIRTAGSLAPTGSGSTELKLSYPGQANEAKVVQRYGNLPLSFEINEGQVDRRTKFLSRGPGY